MTLCHTGFVEPHMVVPSIRGDALALGLAGQGQRDYAAEFGVDASTRIWIECECSYALR
jgi:hypothetical protein